MHMIEALSGVIIAGLVLKLVLLVVTLKIIRRNAA